MLYRLGDWRPPKATSLTYVLYLPCRAQLRRQGDHQGTTQATAPPRPEESRCWLRPLVGGHITFSRYPGNCGTCVRARTGWCSGPAALTAVDENTAGCSILDDAFCGCCAWRHSQHYLVRQAIALCSCPLAVNKRQAVQAKQLISTPPATSTHSVCPLVCLQALEATSRALQQPKIQLVRAAGVHGRSPAVIISTAVLQACSLEGGNTTKHNTVLSCCVLWACAL